MKYFSFLSCLLPAITLFLLLSCTKNQVQEKTGENNVSAFGRRKKRQDSLSILMKNGLFQLDGSTTENPVYQINSPIFNKIAFTLDNKYYQGKQFIINAKNNSKENRYVRSVKLNGKLLIRMFLYHNEIFTGGELIL